jgi:hypothetical protein
MRTKVWQYDVESEIVVIEIGDVKHLECLAFVAM